MLLYPTGNYCPENKKKNQVNLNDSEILTCDKFTKHSSEPTAYLLNLHHLSLLKKALSRNQIFVLNKILPVWGCGGGVVFWLGFFKCNSFF